MATAQRTIDYLLEQLAGAGDITTRKMFGEYALYYESKVVAFICDDRLFIKPTEPVRELLGEVTLGKPYPGAKGYFEIAGEDWEDADRLTDIVRTTADALPLPAPKKPRRARQPKG
jgi:DNA transformation protein